MRLNETLSEGNNLILTISSEVINNHKEILLKIFGDLLFIPTWVSQEHYDTGVYIYYGISDIYPKVYIGDSADNKIQIIYNKGYIELIKDSYLLRYYIVSNNNNERKDDNMEGGNNLILTISSEIMDKYDDIVFKIFEDLSFLPTWIQREHWLSDWKYYGKSEIYPKVKSGSSAKICINIIYNNGYIELIKDLCTIKYYKINKRKDDNMYTIGKIDFGPLWSGSWENKITDRFFDFKDYTKDKDGNITIDLPGETKDSLEITQISGIVRIKGNNRKTNYEFTTDNIIKEAKYWNGVLILLIEPKENKKERRINII